MLSNAWHWARNSLVPGKIQQNCKKMQKVRERVIPNATAIRLRVLWNVKKKSE
jgi:hypothetical protein